MSHKEFVQIPVEVYVEAELDESTKQEQIRAESEQSIKALMRTPTAS